MRCLALEARVSGAGKHACQPVGDGYREHKNTIPTVALAAKIGTCVPGRLASASKNSYTLPATNQRLGVITAPFSHYDYFDSGVSRLLFCEVTVPIALCPKIVTFFGHLRCACPKNVSYFGHDYSRARC